MTSRWLGYTWSSAPTNRIRTYTNHMNISLKEITKIKYKDRRRLFTSIMDVIPIKSTSCWKTFWWACIWNFKTLFGTFISTVQHHIIRTVTNFKEKVHLNDMSIYSRIFYLDHNIILYRLSTIMSKGRTGRSKENYWAQKITRTGEHST